jgi:hypothetical protein
MNFDPSASAAIIRDEKVAVPLILQFRHKCGAALADAVLGGHCPVCLSGIAGKWKESWRKLALGDEIRGRLFSAHG